MPREPGRTAREAARRTIEETRIIRLSVEDQLRFVEIRFNPPPPSLALERAQAAHSRLIRESQGPVAADLEFDFEAD